jgi:hypothetical protein
MDADGGWIPENGAPQEHAARILGREIRTYVNADPIGRRDRKPQVLVRYGLMEYCFTARSTDFQKNAHFGPS